MYHIALKIQKTDKTGRYANLNLKYLYVSRQSLLPVYYDGDLIELFKFMQVIEHKVPIYEFGKRLNILLDINETESVTPEFLHRVNSSNLASCIEYSLSCKKKEAIKYFESEGLLNTDTYGIVDIGWSGRYQDVIKKISHKNVHGFYFYTHNKSDVKHSYLTSLDVEDKFFDRVKVLEAICIANHGQVTGYKDGNPTFSNVVTGFPMLIYESMLSGILSNPYDDKLDYLSNDVIDVINKPDIAICNVFKYYNYSALDCETDVTSFVQPFTLNEFIDVNGCISKYTNRWCSASYKVSPFYIKLLISLYEWLKCIKLLVSTI